MKALNRCAKKAVVKQQKRADVRAARESHQQARDEARRTGRTTSVNAGPTTPEAEEPFDFIVMVSPSPQKTQAGAAAKYAVQVLPKGKGKPKSVLLALGGTGVFDLVKSKRAYWNFAGSQTTEGTPPFRTTLTITTTDSSIPGDYPLAVRGTGGTLTRTGDFDLEILATDKPLPTKQPAEKPAEWSAVEKKLKKDPGRDYTPGEDFGKPLTKEEFLVYLRKLEDENKDMSWKTLTAYLHARAYDSPKKKDLERTLGKTLKTHPELENIPFLKESVFNTPLFIHVPETNKWKDVKDNEVGELYGRIIIDDDKENVDLGHSYAGLRSDIGRSPGAVGVGVKLGLPGAGILPTLQPQEVMRSQEIMQMVNTDAGDFYQVIGQVLDDYKKNEFTRGYTNEKSVNGLKQNLNALENNLNALKNSWDKAKKEWAPEQQLRGNAIGHKLSRYYQDPKNANKKLSEAYADIFASKKK
ncbi:MAG: hypothetical protein Q7R76_03980 [Candidatus Woesearchaeota archaeon]|nr:hypothetical protein [Candidatus Woesearchaeota archaeon]